MSGQVKEAAREAGQVPGQVPDMQRSRHRRWLPLYLLIAVCVAPVIASYFVYYVAPPDGRTNYGTLIDPQRPVPALRLEHLDGSSFDFSALRGQWVMLSVDSGGCKQACEGKLWNMRQVRLTAGKDMDRVARVMLLTDREPVETRLLREFDGTRFLRAEPAQLRALFETPGASPSIAGHVWMIDPLGNLMLRWPPGADPQQMKRDLSRVLRASRIG